jgi:hypothetical protein
MRDTAGDAYDAYPAFAVGDEIVLSVGYVNRLG